MSSRASWRFQADAMTCQTKTCEENAADIHIATPGTSLTACHRPPASDPLMSRRSGCAKRLNRCQHQSTHIPLRFHGALNAVHPPHHSASPDRVHYNNREQDFGAQSNQSAPPNAISHTGQYWTVRRIDPDGRYRPYHLQAVRGHTNRSVSRQRKFPMNSRTYALILLSVWFRRFVQRQRLPPDLC